MNWAVIVVSLGLTLGVGSTGLGLAQPAGTKKLNKFTGNAEAAQQGRALYLKYGCSACHGVAGGGGMGVPLNDDVWKFGSSDEEVFKLIKGEVAASTMPKVFAQQMTDEEIWKVVAYMRSIYVGDPSRVNW
jgi:mono/diheme cytochrome c family protein